MEKIHLMCHSLLVLLKNIAVLDKLTKKAIVVTNKTYIFVK